MKNLMEKMENLCGVANTNVFEWLEDDGLLTEDNLKTLHLFALLNMSDVEVEEDADGFFHIINEWNEKEEMFCHHSKEEAQYWKSLENSYFAIFYKK